MSEPQRVIAAYYLVDILGYYGEQHSKERVMAIWRDAFHVAWASRTQVLIANDKKLHKKAELTYKIIGNDCVVRSPEEAELDIDDFLLRGEMIRQVYTQFENEHIEL